MAEKYVVVNGIPSSCRYFTHFVGKQPYFSYGLKQANVFTDKKEAEAAAYQCKRYTGRVWKVIDMSIPAWEELKRELEESRQVIHQIIEDMFNDT